jgi:hypothetical protein
MWHCDRCRTLSSQLHWQPDCACHCLQRFTFCWQLDVPSSFINIEAAAATLRSMAGRLTDLEMWCCAPELLTALQQAGPALAKSLSSLCFNVHTSDPQRDFCAAAQAVRGIAAGLQHVEIGLAAYSGQNWSASQHQAADAAFVELMRSLPVCQRMGLHLGGCVSLQAQRQGLLHHAPHLLTLNIGSRHGYEQVTSTMLHLATRLLRLLFQARAAKIVCD